jgi:hypothetical protein
LVLVVHTLQMVQTLFLAQLHQLAVVLVFQALLVILVVRAAVVKDKLARLVVLEHRDKDLLAVLDLQVRAAAVVAVGLVR